MLMLQSSSNQPSSLRDNLVLNVPQVNSPMAQDSVAQSPGQVSDSSFFQRSADNTVENCPESPWLDRELQRFYPEDLHDVLGSPVQERSLQEDVIRRAKTELKHHDSAIDKHLVKKAALEEKSKSWQLDWGVSSSIADSDEGSMGPLETVPAIEKRILELEESSKRQDLAIQNHQIKKATLERGIKRHLDYEPRQPSKKAVFTVTQGGNAEDDTHYYCSGEPLAPSTELDSALLRSECSNIPAVSSSRSNHSPSKPPPSSSLYHCRQRLSELDGSIPSNWDTGERSFSKSIGQGTGMAGPKESYARMSRENLRRISIFNEELDGALGTVEGLIYRAVGRDRTSNFDVELDRALNIVKRLRKRGVGSSGDDLHRFEKELDEALRIVNGLRRRGWGGYGRSRFVMDLDRAFKTVEELKDRARRGDLESRSTMDEMTETLGRVSINI